MTTLTVEALAREIWKIDPCFKRNNYLAEKLVPFIERHIADQPLRSISVDAEIVAAMQSIEADESEPQKDEKERLLFVMGEYDFSMPVQAFNVIAGMMVSAKPPKDAGLCDNCAADGRCMKRQALCAANGTADAKPAGAVPLPACTCPSGDGSLRWPCPTHPSSGYEQGWREVAAELGLSVGLPGCPDAQYHASVVLPKIRELKAQAEPAGSEAVAGLAVLFDEVRVAEWEHLVNKQGVRPGWDRAATHRASTEAGIAAVLRRLTGAQGHE